LLTQIGKRGKIILIYCKKKQENSHNGHKMTRKISKSSKKAKKNVKKRPKFRQKP
jgi:hypothetical protein